MMNLELKGFSLYDFLNLSLIKIYEPFSLSISKKYELVYVSKVPGAWRVSSLECLSEKCIWCNKKIETKIHKN